MPTLTTPVLSAGAHAGTAAVRLASRLRGERAIHGRGQALTATVDVPGGAGTGAPLLDEPGTYEAVVRLSRSAGLPLPLPDVLGLAVRVLDAHGPGRHQDLLLDSAGPEPLRRRWPWPGRDFARVTYSSLLPYDVGGDRVVLGARAVADGPVRDLTALPQPLSFQLLVAPPHGPWRPVARLTTTGVLPAPEGRRLRFRPGVTGGGIRPAGPFQQWRDRAYPASHVAHDER